MPREMQMASALESPDELRRIQEEIAAARPDLFRNNPANPAVPERAPVRGEPPLSNPPAVPTDQPQDEQYTPANRETWWRKMTGKTGTSPVQGFSGMGGNPRPLPPAPQAPPAPPPAPPVPQAPRGAPEPQYGFVESLMGVPQRVQERKKMAMEQARYELGAQKDMALLEQTRRQQQARDAITQRLAKDNPMAAAMNEANLLGQGELARLTGLGDPGEPIRAARDAQTLEREQQQDQARGALVKTLAPGNPFAAAALQSGLMTATDLARIGGYNDPGELARADTAVTEAASKRMESAAKQAFGEHLEKTNKPAADLFRSGQMTAEQAGQAAGLTPSPGASPALVQEAQFYCKDSPDPAACMKQFMDRRIAGDLPADVKTGQALFPNDPEKAQQYIIDADRRRINTAAQQAAAPKYIERVNEVQQAAVNLGTQLHEAEQYLATLKESEWQTGFGREYLTQFYSPAVAQQQMLQTNSMLNIAANSKMQPISNYEAALMMKGSANVNRTYAQNKRLLSEIIAVRKLKAAALKDQVAKMKTAAEGGDYMTAATVSGQSEAMDEALKQRIEAYRRDPKSLDLDTFIESGSAQPPDDKTAPQGIKVEIKR